MIGGERDRLGERQEEFEAELETSFQEEIDVAVNDLGRALGDEWSVGEREPMFIDVARMLKYRNPPHPWLVRDLITRGGITTIGGEPKSCKTWLATEIAVAVATSTPVFGEFKTHASGGVAYFYAEDRADAVRTRIRALLAGREVSAPEQRLFAQPAGLHFDLVKRRDVSWLVASCRRLGRLSLLVLDPLRDLSSAAEDSSDEMSEVMRHLRVVATLLHCTVAIVHHSAKASGGRGGQRLRGSGAIHGATDSGVYIRSDQPANGGTLFRSEVQSEIKGARSGGNFTAELRIEDGPSGEAKRATWAVLRSVPSVGLTDAGKQTDDDAILKHVGVCIEAGESPTRTSVRAATSAHRVPDRRARAALARLLATKRVVDVGGRIALPSVTS